MTESKKHSPHGRTVLTVGTARGSGEAKGVIVEGSVMPDGREAWRIISGDKIISLITSSTSTAIMDEAVQIYGPALKRLAKR